MYTARQWPIGTNTVYFIGAGFVPDIGSILNEFEDLF